MPATELAPHEVEGVELLVVRDEPAVAVADRTAHVRLDRLRPHEVHGLGDPHVVLHDLHVPQPREQREDGEGENDEERSKRRTVLDQKTGRSRRRRPGRARSIGQMEKATMAVVKAVMSGAQTRWRPTAPNTRAPLARASSTRTKSTKRAKTRR